ncbi:MAG: hypothetical protein IJD43_09945 [Thermoguttaceae bacterium]|nr:hypothetical protein [Thermoguttaceae bacterium]
MFSIFFLFFWGVMWGVVPSVQAETVPEESEEARKVRLEAQKLENRKLWEEWTVGKNLAFGKRALLVPKPDFFKNYQRLGFNAVPTFPRYWPEDDAQCEPMRSVNRCVNIGVRLVSGA